MRSGPARRDLLRLLLAAPALGPSSAVALAEEAGQPPLAFGVFPFLPALEIGRRFGPAASALAEMIKRPVSLQTKTDFTAFRRFLRDGRYDIAFVHPFLYTDAATVQDYRPLGRIREDLTAFVVACKETPCRSFDELRGKVLALPPRLSGVAQLAMDELEEQQLLGPDGVRIEFFRTKASCIHAVVSGAAVACVLPGFILDHLDDFAPIALEPKLRTRSVPGILLVAHARLGEPLLTELVGIVLRLDRHPAGRNLLAAFGWTGFVTAEPAEYDAVRLRRVVDG